MAKISPIVVPCPVCGEDMPPIRTHISTASRGRNTLTVNLEPVLDEEWRERMQAEHENCVRRSA